ncbi:MAG TPA: 30S ribosome-binding factor RbfA [Anaerolineaceae bacterium]|nr:30S ribosome-binding factor RbfA [Anaerolineaceae bacterium]
MPSQLRLQRIADRIREELSEMVVMEISDPRLLGISITDVKVDREFTFADIFVSAVEGHERAEEVLAGLNHASGFIRKNLATRVDLRIFPRLRFHWDPTPEKADHIEQLLASLRKENEVKPASENASEGAERDGE